jgi:hypothetical protein
MASTKARAESNRNRMNGVDWVKENVGRTRKKRFDEAGWYFYEWW